MNKPGAVVRSEYLQGKGNVIRHMFREIDVECYIMVDGGRHVSCGVWLADGRYGTQMVGGYGREGSAAIHLFLKINSHSTIWEIR